jgi:hypothetical protein
LIRLILIDHIPDDNSELSGGGSNSGISPFSARQDSSQGFTIEIFLVNWQQFFVKEAFTKDFKGARGFSSNQGPIGDLEMVNLLKPATDKDLEG